MSLRHLKVGKIVRRRDLDGSCPECGFDHRIRDNRKLAIEEGKPRLFADKSGVTLVIRIDCDGDISQNCLRSDRRHLDITAAVGQRVAEIVQRVLPFFVFHLDVADGGADVTHRRDCFLGGGPDADDLTADLTRRTRGLCRERLDLLGDDGAWHEGAADWVYGLGLFLLFADAYRRAGADVRFVGHPAVDAAANTAVSGETVRKEWGVGGGPLVGLLPGSRGQEVRTLLPPMLDAARRLRGGRGAQFVLPLAAPHLGADVGRAVAAAGVPVRVLGGRALDVMAASDVVVVASGTATVEAACVGVPMVVVYRLSRLTEWIARRFVIPPDLGRHGYSIPSIVLGRPIVPELIQDAVSGPRISAEVERLLTDSAARRQMLADLAEGRRRLGAPGAVERAAEEVLARLDSRAAGTLR